mgnify:CR=1 FL=1
MALALHNAKGLSGIDAQAEVKYYTSGGAITTGDWVSGNGTTCIPADVDAVSTRSAIGVALDTTTGASQPVRVCVAGKVAANVATGTAAGASLTSGAVAGRAVAFDPGASDPASDGGACGICVTLAADNSATVLVSPRSY